MDLFTPIVPTERFHSNFQAALSPLSLGEREVLEEWAHGFVDRDHKFVREFQTSFNSCFWELYLHAVFKKFGFGLDWSHAAPDFSVSREGSVFHVEATTANAAQGKPNEWDRELSPEALAQYPVPVINREATIRLSNAITAKHRKYRDDYRKLNHVGGRPFVIAVAPFEQPFFNLQHDRPVRCLLFDDYVDEEPYLKDPGKFPNGPPSVSLGTITKDNGAEIELGFFNSEAMEEVSAVVFSCVATWGKANALSRRKVKKSVFQALRTRTVNGPERIVGDQASYHETLEDGLQVYHNPHAKVPLDPAIFRREGIVQFYSDPERGWVRDGFEGALAWRHVWSVGSSEALQLGAPTGNAIPGS